MSIRKSLRIPMFSAYVDSPALLLAAYAATVAISTHQCYGWFVLQHGLEDFIVSSTVSKAIFSRVH